MFKPNIRLNEEDTKREASFLNKMINAGCFVAMDKGEFVGQL